MSSLSQFLNRFLRDDAGTVTFEFMFVMPAVLLIFFSTYENAISMTRQVMLDRGLDLAVRAVRINTGQPPTYAQLRKMICDGAIMVRNCTEDLRLEMVLLDPRGTISPPSTADCNSRAEPNAPVRNFSPGTDNQLMLLRACVLFRPLFPTTRLGKLRANDDGEYALVAMQAYAAEPSI